MASVRVISDPLILLHSRAFPRKTNQNAFLWEKNFRLYATTMCDPSGDYLFHESFWVGFWCHPSRIPSAPSATAMNTSTPFDAVNSTHFR